MPEATFIYKARVRELTYNDQRYISVRSLRDVLEGMAVRYDEIGKHDKAQALRELSRDVIQ